jgi:hypothetical protein
MSPATYRSNIFHLLSTGYTNSARFSTTCPEYVSHVISELTHMQSIRGAPILPIWLHTCQACHWQLRLNTYINEPHMPDYCISSLFDQQRAHMHSSSYSFFTNYMRTPHGDHSRLSVSKSQDRFAFKEIDEPLTESSEEIRFSVILSHTKAHFTEFADGWTGTKSAQRRWESV